MRLPEEVQEIFDDFKGRLNKVLERLLQISREVQKASNGFMWLSERFQEKFKKN